MAMSLGVFSSFLAGETATFVQSSSPSGIRSTTIFPAFNRSHGNLRTVTYAAATPKPATETKKREPRGIMKPRPVSPEMQAVVGVPEIPRTQALKLIWAYIKENNLQDPENKKVIICDEKLKKIFKGNARVGFLEIAGLISPHFL